MPVLGAATSHNTQQTNLASQFAPPVPERDPVSDRMVAQVGLGFLVSAIPVGLIAYYACQLSYRMFGVPLDERGYDASSDRTAGVVVLALIVAAVAIACVVVSRFKPLQRRWQKEARVRFEQAMFWWHNTFFCHRCGHRFSLPGVQPPVAAEPEPETQ